MSALRRNLMLGTAGHVDHGKSALVKLLTGCETDTLAEEKQRGLTIDLGFAPCQLSDKRVVGVVDVPGHVDFIRNMVAGAHGIDVVIFVVAADDGIMPQTHEHLHILTLMGLRHGLVALTKIDLVEAARREAVTQDLRRLLADTFLAGAPICPVSNLSGKGFDGFFDALNDMVETCGDRPCPGPFRMWVEDAFSIRGAGTVVTGIPTHGRVRPGDEVHLLPAGQPGRVRRMQVYGEDATEGGAGECVALNVPELDPETVRRGMVLAASTSLEPATVAEAELQILKSIPGKIKDRLEVQFHAGTASVAARLTLLEDSLMAGGQKQWVQIRLSAPLPLAPGERFVVRANIALPDGNGLTTIGGGQILGLGLPRLRRKKASTLDLLAARRAAVADPLPWCEQMVRESELPATVAGLQKVCWSRADEIAGALEKLRAENRVIPAPGGGWLHRAVVQTLAERLVTTVQAFHTANPQHTGISREALAAALQSKRQNETGSAPAPGVAGHALVSSSSDARSHAQATDFSARTKFSAGARKTAPGAGALPLLEAAVESLIQAKQLERHGVLLAQACWNARLPERDQLLCDQLAAKWLQAGWSPPSLEEMAVSTNELLPRVTLMARLLVERGVLVRLDDRIWMHREAVAAGRQTALKLFQKAPAFSTMEFRDALGVSRKFAVPLVDYLDKIRFTVRSGNNRTPGVEAKKLLP